MGAARSAPWKTELDAPLCARRIVEHPHSEHRVKVIGKEEEFRWKGGGVSMERRRGFDDEAAAVVLTDKSAVQHVSLIRPVCLSARLGPAARALA
eukprot:137518-Pleurochrysis_carterae.AAC.1